MVLLQTRVFFYAATDEGLKRAAINSTNPFLIISIGQLISGINGRLQDHVEILLWLVINLWR